MYELPEVATLTQGAGGQHAVQLVGHAVENGGDRGNDAVGAAGGVPQGVAGLGQGALEGDHVGVGVAGGGHGHRAGVGAVDGAQVVQSGLHLGRRSGGGQGRGGGSAVERNVPGAVGGAGEGKGFDGRGGDVRGQGIGGLAAVVDGPAGVGRTGEGDVVGAGGDGQGAHLADVGGSTTPAALMLMPLPRSAPMGLISRVAPEARVMVPKLRFTGSCWARSGRCS